MVGKTISHYKVLEKMGLKGVKSCNIYIKSFLNSVSSANRRLILRIVAPALA